MTVDVCAYQGPFEAPASFLCPHCGRIHRVIPMPDEYRPCRRGKVRLVAIVPVPLPDLHRRIAEIVQTEVWRSRARGEDRRARTLRLGPFMGSVRRVVKADVEQADQNLCAALDAIERRQEPGYAW